MQNGRNDLAQLDELLEELSGETEAQCELLREHLETARVYLVGAMPTEYALNLTLAREVLNCVADQNLRRRLEDFIATSHKNPIPSHSGVAS